VEETHVSLKRKPSVVEAGVSCTLTVIIELVFERNTDCPLGTSKGRNAHFVPNSPIQLS
jgi:hypothetical protein